MTLKFPVVEIPVGIVVFVRTLLCIGLASPIYGGT